MMGGSHYGFAGAPGIGDGIASQNPWTDQSGSGLAHDAGIDDIGASPDHGDDGSRAGFFDSASNDDDHDDMDLDSDDFGSDGGSDYA
jgi:hypothetical protein